MFLDIIYMSPGILYSVTYNLCTPTRTRTQNSAFGERYDTISP